MAITFTSGIDTVDERKANFIASEVITIDRANAAMGFGWGATIPRMIVNVGVGNWGIVNATSGAYNASAVHSGNTVYFTGMSLTTTDAFRIKVVNSQSDFSVI